MIVLLQHVSNNAARRRAGSNSTSLETYQCYDRRKVPHFIPQYDLRAGLQNIVRRSPQELCGVSHCLVIFHTLVYP